MLISASVDCLAPKGFGNNNKIPVVVKEVSPAMTNEKMVSKRIFEPSTCNNDDDRQLVDIVIIGAGAAGLQCASSLLDHFSQNENNQRIRNNGVEPRIMILEARDRLGGRILTTMETRCLGQGTHPDNGNENDSTNGNNTKTFPYDHGAAWVHGIGCDGDNGRDGDERNPMVQLLEDMTAPDENAYCKHLYPVFVGNPWTRPDTVLHKTGSVAVYMDGELIANESVITAKAIRFHYDLLKKVAAYSDELYDIGEGMQNVFLSIDKVRSEILAKTRIMENGNTNHEDDKVKKLYPLYNFLMENWNGLASSDLQVGCVSLEKDEEVPETDELYSNDGDYEGPHCKVKGGLADVLQPLMKKIADRRIIVRKNEQVVKIEKKVDHVLLRTASGRKVEARCCISSLPIGCLQRFADELFEPRLSDEKFKAINSISPGSYKKVLLSFSSIFWSCQEPLMALVRDKSKADALGQYLLVFNLWAKDSIPCLEAILSGNLGKWAIHRKDEEIQSAVIKFLQDALGICNLQECCTGCQITRWEEDPFTLGTYSSFHLGTLERHVEEINSPEWDGRLIFAGDFLDTEHMGGVHAALISGKTAASKVVGFLHDG